MVSLYRPSINGNAESFTLVTDSPEESRVIWNAYKGNCEHYIDLNNCSGKFGKEMGEKVNVYRIRKPIRAIWLELLDKGISFDLASQSVILNFMMLDKSMGIKIPEFTERRKEA